jgi:hypothetical protein
VVDAPELESRQYAQGWHALRQLGVEPPAEVGKRVLGVILEVGLKGGLDTLAAYADRSARYINHGGNMIVWEAADPRIEGLISNLLRAGQAVADRIGPWLEPRRPAPTVDRVRLNMLTPSGLHFGEGPMAGMSTDELGGPVIAAGAALMQALIERAKQQG